MPFILPATLSEDRKRRSSMINASEASMRELPAAPGLHAGPGRADAVESGLVRRGALAARPPSPAASRVSRHHIRPDASTQSCPWLPYPAHLRTSPASGLTGTKITLITVAAPSPSPRHPRRRAPHVCRLGPGTWLPHRNRPRRTQPPPPGTWTEFPAPEPYAKSEHRPARRLSIEATVRL
jgi:hypothetical protein